MKVLLFSNIRGPDRYLPLNLLSIATYLKAIGCDAVVIDGQIERDWLAAVEAVAPESDLLGVSSYTGPSVKAVIDVISLWKTINPEKKIIWGGYHGTLEHKAILQEGLADFVVSGYGEKAIEGVIGYLSGKQELSSVPNLSYQSGGSIHVNAIQRIPCMDMLPPLDYDYVDVKKYYTNDRRIVHYISSYGCPHACAFCAEPTHSERKWIGFSVPRIINDLVRIQEKYNPDRISFVDPNLSSNPYRIIELAKALVKLSAEIRINCNMRARDILVISSKLDIEILYKAGFRRVFIGVESGSDEQLAIIRKGSRADESYRAITLMDSHGIEVQASFIHDLPGETESQARETIDLARRLLGVQTDGATQSHHFYMPYPGTELTERLAKDGQIIAPHSQADWAQTSTFQGSKLWNGDSHRRQWVISELKKLHLLRPDVITQKEVRRLEAKAGAEHDYVSKFML